MQQPPRNGTAQRGKTIRQRWWDQLKIKLENMKEDGEDLWLETYEGDLDDVDNTNCPCAALDFGTEEKIDNTFPCTTYRVPVFVNFRFRGERGLDEHNIYLYYLGLLQAALLGEHNLEDDLGVLTLDVDEVSNSSTIIGVEGVYPGGTLVLEVTYKTRLHNPYNSPHEP